MADPAYREGQTATNPKTGQRLKFTGGFWVADGGAPGPKLDPVQQEQIRSEALDKIRLARSLQQRSKDGWFVTGFGASTTGGFSGSAANDLRLDTETLKNAGALQRVMQLSKDNGGKNPLTPLSNADFQALASSLANLDPTQSDAQYQRNIQRVIDLYQRAYESAGGSDLEGELSGKPQAKGGDQASGASGATDGSGMPPTSPPTRPEGTVQFNDEAPEVRAGSSRLTPQQEAYISGVAQKGGTPEEIIAAHQLFGKELAPDRAEAIFKAYQDPRNRDKPLPFDYSKDEAIKPVDAGDGAAGARARGLANGLLLGFDDEIGGTINAITSGGNVSDEIDRLRGQKLFDEQNNGGSRFLGQIVGGLPLGGVEFGGARAASKAAGVAAMRAGLGREVAMMQANRAFAMRSALEGAAIGGVYGAGEADGALADRAIGAAGGAAFGGATAGALSLGGGALLNRRALAMRQAGAPALTQGQETLAAAERQGISPFAADVGPSAVRNATAGAAQTIGGVGPIRRAAQETLDTAQAVRDRVAASLGVAASPEAAGEAARAGAKAYQERTSTVGGRLYAEAERQSRGAKVRTPGALRVLDEELLSLRETPGGGEGVARLQGLRAALAESNSVRGLRNMRTVLRDEFEQSGLRFSNIERIANRVVDAANDDIVAGLRAQGKDGAADAYRVADGYWRQRVERIDDYLEPIIGGRNNPKSGEEVMQGLTRAMSGNNKRFAGFLKSLPNEEQGILRASLVQRLGQATKSNQDDAGEVFSLATFLTNWNDIGETAKARLFGTEGRAALNDLAKVAYGSRQAQRFAGFSNSGAIATTSGLIGAGGAGTVIAGPAALVALASTVLAQYGAGRLLASPKFARWLARAPKSANPAAQRAWMDRLTRIARSEPTIAQDLTGLRARLQEALGRGAMPAAAEPDDEPDWIDRYARENSAPAQSAQP